MSQTVHEDLERGSDADDDHVVGETQLTPNQSSRPSQGGSNFRDTSEKLFTMYSKTAKEEDNRMVEQWKSDADGILIFTGLFSAVVASLLVGTVRDLKPNSQDTSAFYLGNIYEVLADSNVTRASIPSPVAKPPPFSSPRYVVWVNSLWFSSMVIGLGCSVLATLLSRWASRYIRLTQPVRCRPEKRARMHAFFADGMDKMHISWAIEGLPTLLHLSVFLFFAGLTIYLFNIDQEVFACVAPLVGLSLTLYGLMTILPLIRHDSPYHTPLTKPIWFLYARIRYEIFKVLAFINSGSYGNYVTWEHCRDLRDRYRGWMLGGMEKAAEEMAFERSSEIDARILDKTITALGDDDSLEKFFEAIPGLFNSNVVKNLERDFPWTFLKTFWDEMDGFMGRTLSSNSVTESVKSRRVIICRDIMSMIPCSNDYVHDNLRPHFDQAPASIERSQAMARWFTHSAGDVSYTARIRTAKNLARMKDSERDGRWIALATDVYGLSKRRLQHNVALGGDNVLLVTLIDVSRRAIHSRELDLVEALTHFDIRHALPVLRHDFCTLWNELAQEAEKQGSFSTPVQILREIRNLYAVLHQGTDATPTAFSASIDSFDPILLQPSSYKFCNIADHRPDSTARVPVPHSRAIPLLTQTGDSPDASPHHSIFGGNTASQQVKEAGVIAGSPLLSDLTTLSEIRDGSQPPAATSPASPAHTNSRHICASTGAASTSNALPPAFPVVAFSLPVFPTSPHLASLPNAEFFSLLSSTTPSRPSGSAAIPRLPARGIVISGSASTANSVLQLLTYSPPFWNMIRELGGGPKSASDATPLVNATVRFLEEFMFKEKEPSLPQQDARGEPREEGKEEEIKAVDSFEPTYMYDAMKEKRQLETFLDGQRQDAEEFLGLYLDALDEELVKLDSSVGTHKLVSPLSVEGREKGARSAEGQNLGKRDYTASSVESPISRIFGGRSRLTVRAPNRPDTVTIEAWRSLRLNIQPGLVQNIQDALAVHVSPQLMKVGQSSSSEANQRVLLEALPPVLVLHLKHSLHDTAVDGIYNINKPVQFASELEIPPEIMAPITGKSPEPVHYKLYGVLYHNGESSSSGHYTVDVLHLNGESGGESWLHIDDESVNAVRHEDVFGAHDNDQVGKRCAYMLFYCRFAPAGA